MKNLRVLIVLLAVLCGAFGGGLRAQAGNRAAKSGASPQLVVIDTDIGDDIDDAFALALALKSPELKVLGVTTTFGNTQMRAQLVDRYLKAVGRADIPVFAGPATKTDNVMTQAAYAKRDPRTSFGDGAEFILRAARQHPGQVTLIGIGPLSTVEAAIKKDPAGFKKLKRVVIMGGSVYKGYGVDAQGKPKPAEPEWNILNDPAGLKALLGSGVTVAMMPLDSTQVPLETQGREAIFAHGSELTDQLTLLYHQWMGGTPNHSPTPTLFDPVAVTYTFRPELCPAKPMHIDVDAKGMTMPGQGAPNAEVCLESNEKGFLDLLVKRVAGE
ncbi:nucleoside hydrolase [Occallatibacter savannae]|uniref:nucleoside hydrolase n=1 Tax=Occallatibacter savannae TaxID=1002691 RepID=UPI000D69853A|nr:nucleoside hydrolase [Occallatibacter savannae]